MRIDNLKTYNQVLICDKIIGWEKGITKIVVLISDIDQHMAGDGILAGIWDAPSHECALEPHDGNYVYRSLKNDYPSISEINYLLDQYDTTLVFGVTKTIFHVFEDLIKTDAIHNSRSTVGEMGKSNI